MNPSSPSQILVKGSVLSLALRVAGVGLGYAANVTAARLLGLHDYGIYVIALGWALVLTLPARGGFDLSVLRYSTIYLEQGLSGRLRGLVEFGAGVVVLASLAAGAAMVLFASWFTRGVPNATILWGAVSIMPLALLGVASGLMRTAQRIFASQFYDQILRPAILLLLFWATVIAGHSFDAPTAMMLTAAAAAAALVGLLIHLYRVLVSSVAGKADHSHWREWLSVSIPLLVMGVMQELLNQLEVILLGYLADARQAGLFAAAWRLASLATFALTSIGAVGGPLVASAYHRRNVGELHRITSMSARLGLGFGAVASVLLLLAGQSLLRLFGPEFTQAYPALAILLVGAMFNAFTGIVGYLLTLTGRQSQALITFGGALILALFLNLTLIPRLGIVGAAIASAATVSAWNIAMLIYVRRTLGIDASAIALRPRIATMI